MEADRPFTKRRLKLTPDYDCFPLWETTPESYDNVDPADLPISAALKEALYKWADRYDATLNRDDPADSQLRDETFELQFREEGVALLTSLQDELGEDFELKLLIL